MSITRGSAPTPPRPAARMARKLLDSSPSGNYWISEVKWRRSSITDVTTVAEDLHRLIDEEHPPVLEEGDYAASDGDLGGWWIPRHAEDGLLILVR